MAYEKMVSHEKAWHYANHFRKLELKKKDQEYKNQFIDKRPNKWKNKMNHNPYYTHI